MLLSPSLLRDIFDFLAPRSCIICHQRLAANDDFLCPQCLADLPYTDYCKDPYENVMTKLFFGLLPVERAAAWFYYTPANDATRLITHAKYYNNRGLCQWMGYHAAAAFDEYHFFDDISCLVPVPLTLRRRLRRGFNQSREIARGVSRFTGIPVITDAVARTHFRQSQTNLHGTERHANVVDAFRLVRPDRIRGKHILLIDDVCTTGSTLYAVATACATAEDIHLSFMTIGRTREW